MSPIRFVATTALAALIATTLALSGTVHAQKNKKAIDPLDQLKNFKPGLSNRYVIWHGEHNWHLRTTTAKAAHRFKGSIKVEGGKFTKIHSHHLEKEGKYEDHWIVSPDKTEILFDFETKKQVDGLDFHLPKEAKHLKFNLLIDGKHHADRIYTGKNGHHPHNDPFTLHAHPRAKKK